MILGTAAYMSPEQARGQALDSRSDIWAFGCVLYEMLCGTSTFSGDTVTDVLAGIVAREPDWDPLPEETPAQVRSLLWRCLQKDPRQRLRHIGEAAFYLNPPDPAMSSALSSFIPEPTLDAPRRRGSWLVPTLVGVAVGVILGFLGLRTVSDPGPGHARPEVARLNFSTGEFQPFSLRSWTALAVLLSPDGQTVIYSCTPRGEGAFGNQVLLAVRDLSTREIRTIPGVSSAATPFFSPDGSQVAYFNFTQSSLMSVRLEGGSPSELASVDVGFTGGTWYEDESILMTGSRGEGLYRLDLRTAESELLLAIDPANGESAHSRPIVLVDHGLVLFTVFYQDTGRQPTLSCLNMETGKRTDLCIGDVPLGLLPNGRPRVPEGSVHPQPAIRSRGPVPWSARRGPCWKTADRTWRSLPPVPSSTRPERPATCGRAGCSSSTTKATSRTRSSSPRNTRAIPVSPPTAVTWPSPPDPGAREPSGGTT